MYRGDIRLGDTVDIKFSTRSFTTGVPTTLAGTPVISAYVGNGTTEITAGITLSVDFDGRAGLHNIRVVATSGNGFATATNVDLVITTGTVGGVSVVGECVGSFSIEARSALMPTVAARTYDVTATGGGGVDWANVENQSTAVNLSTTIVAQITNVAAGGINASSIADGAIDRATYAADTGLQSSRSNTAQAGGATSITLDASASATTDFYKGMIVYLTGATGVGQGRLITAYNGATKVATVSPAWATNPDVTSTFAIMWAGGVDVQSWFGTVVATPATAGIPDVNVKNIDNDAASASGTVTFPNATLASTTNITAGTLTTVTTATNVTTVNGLAAGVITATSIASDAITAAKIADAAIDTATFAAGTTLPRVTLVDTLTTYTGNTVQTGDSFARIGATGSGLTSLAPSATALSTATWTGTLATNLGTTNTTVATNLNATITSRMATFTLPTNFSSMDINATGGVGLDWGNVQNQTTTVNLTNTSINSVNTVVVPVSADLLNSPLSLDNGEVTASASTTVSYTSGRPTTPACLVGSVVNVYYDNDDALRTGQDRVVTSAVNAGGGVFTLTVDRAWNVNPVAGDRIAVWAFGPADLRTIRGTTSVGAAGYIGIDWSAINAPTTAVNLSGTTTNLVNTVTTYTGNTVQTGDSFSRIGATGSGLSSLAPSATALSTATWTNGLATNLGTTNTTVTTNLDAAVTSRMATYTQPTGFLAATFPGGTIANNTTTPTWYTAPGVAQTGDSFARIGATGSGLSSLAPSATALSTGVWTGALATNLGTSNTTIATNLNATVGSRATQVAVDDLPTNAEFAAAMLLLATSAQMVKSLAAIYDTATGSGGNVLTLSNGATQTINLSTGTRTTVG